MFGGTPDTPFGTQVCQGTPVGNHWPRLPILPATHVVKVLCILRSKVQVSFVIRGRYVPSFWTANLEFADKKSIFDCKIDISYVNNRIRR
jgi:hypothetical protein